VIELKNRIQNIEIVFGTTLRVPFVERNNKWYYYDVRHDDECQGIPCELNNIVFFNHLATIATTKPLQIGRFGYELSEIEQTSIINALYRS
jgi:hypothetical protein